MEILAIPEAEAFSHSKLYGENLALILRLLLHWSVKEPLGFRFLNSSFEMEQMKLAYHCI